MSKNCTKPGPRVESERYRGMSFKSASIIYRDLVLIACLGIVPAHAQDGAQNGEWRFFGGDTGSTKYSPLDQIDKDNVADLQVAWRWRSVDGQFDLDRLTQEYPNLQVPNDVDTVQIFGPESRPSDGRRGSVYLDAVVSGRRHRRDDWRDSLDLRPQELRVGHSDHDARLQQPRPGLLVRWPGGAVGVGDRRRVPARRRCRDRRAAR